MFFSVYDLVADEIIFDNILETSVISQKSELDDMVAKLLPLHCLVSVDVDLFEEVDERKC